MERENSIEMSRPKAFRRLNLESSQRSSSQVNSRTSENASMSPMTNLVHNLSGASLDSTPKRKPSFQGIYNQHLFFSNKKPIQLLTSCPSSFSHVTLLSYILLSIWCFETG